MIFGIFETDKNRNIQRETLWKMCQAFYNGENDNLDIYVDHNIGLGFIKLNIPTLNNEIKIFHNENKSIIVAVQGNIFNKSEIRCKLQKKGRKFFNNSEAELLLRSYEEIGEECIKQFRGGFIVFIWDKNNSKLLLGRDQLGIEPLYYFWDGNRFIFSSLLKVIINNDNIEQKLNIQALYKYLLFNYIPGQASIYSNVKKLRPGHLISIKGTEFSINKYWYLKYKQVFHGDESECRSELLKQIKDAIRIRSQADNGNIGAFLSGGMDSSSVVGLMCTLVETPVHTFSFRCTGKSFDESYYARIISDYYQTQHHLVEFQPGKIATISKIVEYMDEPFCDIGIEIASYLLGQEAEGITNNVFTGDGGDELFAGHPVYLADRVARTFEKVPHLLQRPITTILQFLPDTDKKKSLLIKAKRFSYSFNFPSGLYSNRWRIYYTRDELEKLCKAGLIKEFERLNPLDEIMGIYHEADGPDYLSKTLYGDYNTVVEFYLRRMRLLRAFRIEGRFPMLDHRLVEYVATIPSELKIKNSSETKYILHKTMAGILPDEIVYRKDKLGHSVPMKNWMRESHLVQEFIFDVLSESTINKRGYFNSTYIQKLISQHLKKTHNHSHRLWGLVVLELWLQKNMHY